jgi:hypothetical protein
MSDTTVLHQDRALFEEAKGMEDCNDLPIGARVMAPLGDVLYRGVVVEPPTKSLGESMVCVEFVPPVAMMKPFDSVTHTTCPASRLTRGWL